MRAFVLTCCLLLSIGCGKNSPTGEPGEDVEETLAAQLQPAEEVLDYYIRLPRGYEPRESQLLPRTEILKWEGPARDDGTRPLFMVTLTTLTDQERQDATLEILLQETLHEFQSVRTDWSTGPIRQGRLNGLSYVRCAWSGTEKLTARRSHGFLYMLQDGPTIIQIRSQDVEPHHAETLKVADAAARTFRKN